MVHANLNWTFGPLKYVFASPVFHRWHHTLEDEGLDKNFAPTFPVLDLIFGTFYMPPGKLPARFGVHDTEFPEGFLGQFVYPFRRSGALRASERLGDHAAEDERIAAPRPLRRSSAHIPQLDRPADLPVR
jgi:hypothetical protein